MDTKIKLKKLTPEEEKVMVFGGTEMPFSGGYNSNFKEGIYVCRRCGLPIYRSEDKFEAGCGWPSFDKAIKGSVKRSIDLKAMGIEIKCARCGAHLGHVFYGEGFTPRNVRHCVNSISLKFIPKKEIKADIK